MNNKPNDLVADFYKKRGFAGRVGFGQKPCVLVVDLILGFTDKACPLGADLEASLSATKLILDKARMFGLPIFFTTVEYDSDLKNAGLFPKKVSGLNWLVSGSRWVEVDPRLERRPSELLVKKRYASAFFKTDLHDRLALLGVDTVIVTGSTTSGCIRATVVDIMQHDLHAIIPRQAVGDRAQSPHEANLFDMDAKYGDVVELQEVLQYLQSINPNLATPK